MTKKIRRSGVFMQDASDQPAKIVQQTSYAPLKDLDFTPIVVRPPASEGKVLAGKAIRVLSDYEIEAMDERNAEVEALTFDYIMSLLDYDGFTSDDIGLDSEIVTSILDAFEQTLSEFGLYINRPTIVQREDGEHILRSAFDDEEF